MGVCGLTQQFIPIKDVFRALLDGWIVKAGDLQYRIDDHGHLQSRYKEGTWSEITEPFNKVTFMGTEDDLKELQNRERQKSKETEGNKRDGNTDEKDQSKDWRF